MLGNLTTGKDLESVTRNEIRLYHPSFCNWEYKVTGGTHSPDNIWVIFYAKKVEIDEHFILIGKREDHSGINTKSAHLTIKQKKIVDEGFLLRGVSHTKEEADVRLIEICRQEALRINFLYFENTPVKYYDRL